LDYLRSSMMKRTTLICCMAIITLRGYGQVKDTFEVHFPFNISKIDKGIQTYIDQLIFNDKLLHGDKLIVLGYADFVGSKSYNDTLSYTRASNVRNYLIAAGFAAGDIKLCVGKGKIDRTNESSREGYAPDRKVQIIIDRAEMTKKAAEPTAASMSADDKLELDKLEINQTFALNNIFFKLNSPVILEKSQPDLQRLQNFLTRYPTVHVQIEGHVCCMGPVEGTDSKYKGRALSECRAEAIYNYLVEKGISKDRLKYAGLANRNPVVQNEVTEEDRQRNRRVEIRILSK
jgi:outer membrane protein OmpA-like peptidoglycan-associated protein